MRNYSRFVRSLDNYVFKDFDLSNRNLAKFYIFYDCGNAIYRHLKWEIYSTFRDVKNIGLYEGSLSSLERLRITESILEELV